MRCKAGDLAVIVRCDSHPEMIGKLVDVLAVAYGDVRVPDRLWSLFDRIDEPGWWLVRSRGAPIVYPEVLDTSEYAVLPDDRLRPIRPDSEPESTDTPRELEAV